MRCSFLPVTQYGKESLQAGGQGFFRTNLIFLQEMLGVKFPPLKDAGGNMVYYNNGNPKLDYSKPANVVFTHKRAYC
jgi:hypothetical protein